MKFKILAKVVARKGKFVVDCKFWKARGHYASDPDAYTVRWDEEGSREIWRNNYYEIVAEVDGEEEEKKIRTSSGVEEVLGSGSENSNP
ncbi:hypothetical protein DY000_02010472 [Brassica cretica]|uniref:Uncharacterized protein n=1 Tax=Brassica cretica TaxID=69181 RepID=A0ABQ7C5C3_BRACR|nr:hypothetical protein DY000_02010472 [Brassica cretica]